MREEMRSERGRAAMREYAELMKAVKTEQPCRTCGGSGVAVDGLGFGMPCSDCEPRRRAERLQVVSGLNIAECQVRLDSIEPTGGKTDEMVMAARSFLIQPRGILTLYGGSGNAKTIILQAIVNEYLERSCMAVYTTFFDLAGYVREAFRNDSESAWRRVRRFQSVRVLCIDEFDKMKETDWIRELETAIIDRRYRDGLAGVCGTVLAMNDSPALLPDWISSRLYDGRNKVIENRDPDMRPLMSEDNHER